jgi:hypothetical protein
MWSKKYERLAQAVTVTQQRFLRSLVGAANKSIAQQKHQVSYGRLTKQRKELRARTLELAGKQKEALSRRYWTHAALMSGNAGPDFLTDDEERELKELVRRNGRVEDVERFVAANSDWVTMTRTSRRRGEGQAQ